MAAEENNTTHSKEFLLTLASEYQHLLQERNYRQYELHRVSLNNIDFSGADFSGLKRSTLMVFDFAGCILNGVRLDRTSLDVLLPFMRNKTVAYNNINLSDIYLGSKILERHFLGIKCNCLTNFHGIDIKNFDFTMANISEAIFDGCELTGTKFVNCKNIRAKQFIKTKDYKSATFSLDTEEDSRFKKEISILVTKQKTEPLKPRMTTSHFSFAQMMDSADPIRLDDPYYIVQKKEKKEKQPAS